MASVSAASALGPKSDCYTQTLAALCYSAFLVLQTGDIILFEVGVCVVHVNRLCFSKTLVPYEQDEDAFTVR
jgi:hypothetical protein